MANFTFRPAHRQNTPLIIGIAGPTKSGKSYSALRLATGLTGGKPIAMLNTEGARGHMYSEQFTYLAADLTAPFRPTRYTEVIEVMKSMDLGCAIIDTISHMHDGPGGILEWHEEILDRVAGKDYAKRQRSTYVAWVEPKAAENKLIYALQDLTCPIILCMRSKEKIKISDGKVEELGWQPIVGDRIASETIFTLQLLPHSKGVPDLGISDMRDPFDHMVRPDTPIDEDLGRRLAEWARGVAMPTASPLTDIASSAPAFEYRSDEGAVRKFSDVAIAVGGATVLRISEGQVKRLWAIARASNVDADYLKVYLQRFYAVESTSQILLGDYAAIVEAIQKGLPDVPAVSG